MHILKGDTTKADKRLKNEVADLMRTLGCVNGTKRAADGKKVRCWTVPDGLPARASSVRASLTRVK
jgi:hypothetical protein